MSRSEVQIVWRQQLRSSFQPPAYSWGRRAVASFKPTVNIKGCPRQTSKWSAIVDSCSTLCRMSQDHGITKVEAHCDKHETVGR